MLNPDVVAARVGGRLRDLHTPLPHGAGVDKAGIGEVGVDATEVVPLSSKDPEALHVIRHSAAHIMADAVQRLYPDTQVTIGPAIEGGFYYDFDRPAGPFSEEELEAIESQMKEIIAADVPFSREPVTKEQAREFLKSKGEKYKLELLEGMNGEITLYHHGGWTDLCEGPHVPSTGHVRAVKLLSVAGAYWRGDERNPMLQRIYGTAFFNEKALRLHLQQLEEAKKRDHRKLGKELDLFAFSPLAPASPFFLPRGAFVYNALVAYIRDLYRRAGYEEVITPQLFDQKLFRTSGHLPAYKNNMYFVTDVDEAASSAGDLKGGSDGAAPAGAAQVDQVLQTHRYAIKSMNCPGHAVLYKMQRRSYRDLPWRVADFGRLHRYERSGVTQGLTRVRSFCQDDAHIFCSVEDVEAEILSFLEWVEEVYLDFGFDKPSVVIATRPEEKLGDDALWNRAEEALVAATRRRGVDYTIAEGEGAFYGPKIEFHLRDAIGRSWQLGTIQADFNLPERFELSYVDAHNSYQRPVMLHRAILGSVERFFGILVEHLAGAFPTWLAPEQVCLLTVSEKVLDYATGVAEKLEAAGVRTTSDFGPEKLGAKIRRAHQHRHPYVAVIGEKEAEAASLNVRTRGKGADLGAVTVVDFISRVQKESVPPSRRQAS